MFQNTKVIEVSRFGTKWEATGKQSGYINSLCRKVGCTLEQVIEAMFGMSCTAAFSDRPWLRLTRKEASHAIDMLKAEEAAQIAAKRRPAAIAVIEDEPPHDLFNEDHDEIEQERRISCDCPF